MVFGIPIRHLRNPRIPNALAGTPGDRILRMLGLGGIGDDGSGWTGEGYGSNINYGDPSGGYDTSTYVAPVDYSSSGGDNGQVVGDIYSGMDMGTPLFTTEATTTPYDSPQGSPSSGDSAINTFGGELSSFFAEMFQGIPNIPNIPNVTLPPSTGATRGVPQPLPKATVAQKPLAPGLPKPSPTKPAKVGNNPDVNAYEKLFAANLAGFMASSKTEGDKTAGENYFVQEWQVFSQDMGGAGAWGSTGLADRNRGGKYDWWNRYYDPISNYLVTQGTQGSLYDPNASGGAGVGSGMILFLVALGIVWYMTE